MAIPNKQLLLRALLAGTLSAPFAASLDAAPPEVRQVLILQSSDRGLLVYDRFTADFRAALDQRTSGSVTVTEFVIAPAGFTESPEKPIVEFLRAAFVDRSKPHLVVTVGGPAAAFARRHRQQVFPDTPFLFATTDGRFLRDAPLSETETAVPSDLQYAKIVDDILQLLPQTTTVYVVMGAGPLGTFLRGELERDFARFHDRLTFIWSDNESYAQMLRQATSLPPHSAIFFITSGTDAEGGWRGSDRTIAELTAVANAPVFGVQEVWLGLGIVGGTLIFNQENGGIAADVAVRVLNGESPGTIRVPPRTLGPGAAFDARQLRRWNISEARLPPGSDVRFRGPSLWSDYRREALGVLVALSLQSILIIGLLYQRRARRRAETDSRRSLALAADANRRVTMSALTASIAHELSQPLNSIQHNAQAGEMLLAANRATSDTLAEILSDIRSENVRATQIIDRHRTMLRSRPLDKKAIDLHTVVSESVALVAHDMGARQVQVDRRIPPERCAVDGDQVLLKQVLVNLMLNAIDAMADTPKDRRRIMVESTVTGASVAVAVRDSGAGLPAAVDGQLFEPFFTTKANGIGIGLTIARTIVEAHGGRLEADNNPDGGATFTMTLPRSTA